MRQRLKYNLLRVISSFTMMAILVTAPSLSLAQYQPHKVVTKSEFEKIGDRIIEMYDDQITKMNVTVSNRGDWTARADDIRISSINFPFIDIFYNGGGVRSSQLNLDQLSLILCHEMGHLLGKGVRKNDMRIISLAGEGEADYFATSKGIKKLWAGEKGITIEESGLPPQEKIALANRLKQLNVNPLSSEGMMTVRILTAGYFVLTKYNKLKVSFADYDNQVVTKTIRGYPSAQGRLDTYIAGVLNLNRPASWSAPKKLVCKSLF